MEASQTGPCTLGAILKEFYRAMTTRGGRRDLWMHFARNIPGQYGIRIRQRVLRRHFGSAGPGLRIFQGVMIRNIQKIAAGTNVSIGDQVFLQAGGGLELGDNVLIGPGVKIWTQNHIAADPDLPVRKQGHEYARVAIGEDCWIGANAIILPGVKLPRGCIVAAGSVVGVKSYKEYQILMGYPARVIGSRRPPRAAED